MKLSQTSKFPHPILSTTTTDYLKGSFSMTFVADEDLSQSRVALSYEIQLDEPHLRALVSCGSADIGISVVCQDSYFNRVIPLGLTANRISFERGDLIGRVTIRPLIWTTQRIDALPLENCHEEFRSGVVALDPGEILALGNEFDLSVGREKLAQLETIFVLSETDQLKDNALAVNLDSDKIRILAAKQTYHAVNTLRGTAVGRAMMLNSVYLPSLMEVLSTIRDSGDEHENKRWHKVISAKCTMLGIDPCDGEFWRDAQRLLNDPFGELSAQQELLGSF